MFSYSRLIDSGVDTELLPSRRELFIPFVHIPWHTGSSSAWNMHAESRNAVSLQAIAPAKCRFRAQNLPPPLDRKKPAGDFLKIDPFPICSLF